VKQVYTWQRRLIQGTCLGLLGIGVCGCVRVGVHEQRLVSKANMTFEDSAVFGGRPGLIVQIEPGSAVSGGAQAGGCTSCK